MKATHRPSWSFECAVLRSSSVPNRSKRISESEVARPHTQRLIAGKIPGKACGKKRTPNSLLAPGNH
eukprot:6203401-Pleurochrysis_carterae.AAC.1